MNRLCLYLPLLALAVGRGARSEPAARLHAIPTRTSAWQVALADLDDDGKDDAIYAGYDGELTCTNLAEGRELWTAELGGFPYCLTTADLDGDGRPEILATSASLKLHVFSPEGKLLWSFTSGAPLHAIAAGRLLETGIQVVCGGEDMKLYFLSARGKLLKTVPVKVGPNIEAINNLAIGDITGGPENELCMTNGFGIVRLYDPRSGKALWNSRDYSRRFMRDLELWDVNGDGKQEILATSNRIELLDGKGQPLWQAPPNFSRYRGYIMPEAAPVDLNGDGNSEMAILFGPQLSVFDAAGKRVYQQTCDFYYFTTLASGPSHPNQLVLGSLVGADRHLYALEFADGGKDQFAAFKLGPGYLSTINQSLADIRERVLKARPGPDVLDRTYDIWVSGGGPPLKQADWVGSLQADFRAAYPYKNLRFNAFLQYRQLGHKGQGLQLPDEDLLALARKYEREHATHVLAVAHGTDPFMSVEMVRRWIEAAPTACRGIMMHENSYFVNHYIDGTPDYDAIAEQFIDGFMLPVMDVCLEKGRRFYLMEKQLWWVGLPAAKKYAGRILARKYRPILVPMVEESNSRCPELNFVGRVGLWRMGAVERWGLNLIDDQLRTCKLYEYDLIDAHSALRYYIAGAAAGATEFKLGKLMYVFLSRNRKEQGGVKIGRNTFRQPGLLAFDTFMHLLGKGLLVPPSPDEIVGVSPVAFRMNQPAEGLWLSARMTDPAAISPLSRGGLFSGFDWGYTRPHPYYAPAYLMNTHRYCHNFIPENPYGLPLILPAWPEARSQPWIKGTIDTDGVSLLKQGRRIPARNAKTEILRRFTKAAARLPFTAKNVYWMGRKTGANTYRVVLIDPGFLTPEDQDALLTIHAPLRLRSARDVLSGAKIRFKRGTAQVHVPAGTFRLLDLKIAQ